VVEDGGTAWQRPAALAPSLGPANNGLLSWPPGLGVAAAHRSGARHGMEVPRGMAVVARRSREGGRNREATTAEASGEFLP